MKSKRENKTSEWEAGVNERLKKAHRRQRPFTAIRYHQKIFFCHCLRTMVQHNHSR